MAELIRIRYAAPQEREALGELHRRSSWVWVQDRPMLAAHPDALGVATEAIAERRVRVAVDARERLLGFAVVASLEPAVCELDDLFVEPAMIRRGIGRALVADAADSARACGLRCMGVVAHPRNFPFYESVGFTPGQPVATRFGPAVRMTRVL